MSRLTLACTALLALAGCAPESGIITIVNFHSLLANCAVPKDDSPLWANGTMDISLAPSNPAGSAYYVGLVIRATISPGGNSADITVGGTVLESPGRDVPVLDEKVLAYTSTASGLRIPEYHEPFSLKFDYGASTAFIRSGAENLISTDRLATGREQASEALRGSGATPLDLLVNIEYRGHMSRSGAAVSTGPFIAPIYVYDGPTLTGKACTTPREPTRSPIPACPAPGTDFDPITCCDGIPGGLIDGCP